MQARSGALGRSLCQPGHRGQRGAAPWPEHSARVSRSGPWECPDPRDMSPWNPPSQAPKHLAWAVDPASPAAIWDLGANSYQNFILLPGTWTKAAVQYTLAMSQLLSPQNPPAAFHQDPPILVPPTRRPLACPSEWPTRPAGSNFKMALVCSDKTFSFNPFTEIEFTYHTIHLLAWSQKCAIVTIVHFRIFPPPQKETPDP